MTETSAVKRVAAALALIEDDDHNAFITVDPTGAIAEAEASDRRHLSGELLGPLDGQLVAIKDNIDTAGLTTTSGSEVFAECVPEHDADVVARLRRSGAIVIGKTHMTEMACGTTGRNAWLGDARNPHDPQRYPGGSSSGSAVALAAGLVRFAIGSDTSCSIRQPAAMCGIVGFKPTYDLVSTVGLAPCYRSMDHVGPMARTVADAAMLLDAMSSHPEPIGPRLETSVAGLRVGVLGGDFTDRCEPDVVAAFEAAVPLVEALGCTIGDVTLDIDLTAADEATDAFGRDLYDAYADDFAPVEADGDDVDDFRYWLRHYSAITPEQYEHAEASQRSLTTTVDAVMESWDVLICPTTRAGAGLLATAKQEPRHLRTANCALWNITGQPSLSIPCAPAATGMPLGLLLNGRRGDDSVVLRLGHALEQALR